MRSPGFPRGFSPAVAARALAALLLAAGAARAEIVVCPRALEGEAGARTLRADYVRIFADPSSWPTVHARTDTAKFYIAMLDPRHDAPLESLVAMTRRKPLRVEFETGGLRFPHAGAFHDRAGEEQAASELRALTRWTEAGGALDAIATDHAIMHHLSMNHRARNEFTGARVDTPPDAPPFDRGRLMGELMDYFAAMRQAFPKARFGVIESLGYFHIKGRGGRLYPATDPRLPKWDFEEFLDALLGAAKAKGVTIDFFDIDFGFIGSAADTRRLKTPALDVGRTRAAVDALRKRGIRPGIILNDDGRIGKNFQPGDRAARDPDRNRQAHENTLAYWDACRKEKALPDRIVLQSWFDYPERTGPETEPYSFFFTAADWMRRTPPIKTQPKP